MSYRGQSGKQYVAINAGGTIVTIRYLSKDLRRGYAGMKKLSILAATVAAFSWRAPARRRSGRERSQQPERIDGKPNFNGIWQAMNTANWNLEPHSAGRTRRRPRGRRDRRDPRRAWRRRRRHDPLQARSAGAAQPAPSRTDQLRSGSGLLPTRHSARDLPALPFQIVQGDNGDILLVYEWQSPTA